MAKKRPSRKKSTKRAKATKRTKPTKRAKATSRPKAKRSKKKAAQGAGADVGVLKNPWTGKPAKLPVPEGLKPWPRAGGRLKPYPR
jgi:hypothetical protein